MCRSRESNDAIAICEAAGRPSVRFIPVKSKKQQAVLLVHRLRRACVVEHTRIVNRLRGFLAEFGIVAPKGADAFKARWKAIRQQPDQDLPALAWAVLDDLYQDLMALHRRVLASDRQINAFVREDLRAEQLAQINGIGPITASAIVATIGNGRDFSNGRHFPSLGVAHRLGAARQRSTLPTHLRRALVDVDG